MALAAPVSPSTLTTVNDSVASQFISRQARDAARDPLVGEAIVKVVPIDGAVANSLTYQVPIVAEMTGADIVAVPDAAPEVALSTDGATITGSRRGLRSFLPDIVASISTLGMMGETARGLGLAVRDDLHQDILALLTSITAGSGTNATVNDLANWDAQTTAFRAANHGPGPLYAVLNPDQVRDLRVDLATNAAALYGSSFGDRAQTALANTTPGLGVGFDGYTILESANTPAGDTTGWTGALLVGGEDACLEMPVWQTLTGEVQRDVSRFGTWVVMSVVCGIGIIKQANGRRIVSQT